MEDSHRRLVFASTLPSTESAPGASYSLLSLPPALLALISSTAFTTGATPLEIRGHTTDAAVLVTPTETYSLRGVQNSNSLLLCSTAGGGFSFREDDEGGDDAGEGRRKKRKGEEEKIAIEGTLHETLEVVQGVARTDRLVSMLRGSEYSGEDAEEGRDQSVRRVETRVERNWTRADPPRRDFVLFPTALLELYRPPRPPPSFRQGHYRRPSRPSRRHLLRLPPPHRPLVPPQDPPLPPRVLHPTPVHPHQKGESGCERQG